MNVRERLTPTEQALAFLIGAGIFLTIVALMLMAFGSIDNSDITNSLLVVGIALIVIGIIAWLVLVKPWEEFDDLQTPLDTGGHAHGPETHAPAETAAPVAAAPKLPGRSAPAQKAKAAAEAVETKVVPVAEAVEAKVEPVAEAVEEKVVPVAEAVEAKVEPVAEAVEEKVETAAETVETKVETAAEAVEAEPAPAAADDLTAVSGVGPKTAEALAKGGITSYAQMAALSDAELLEIAKSNGARVGNADGWAAEAKRLAAQEPRDNLTLIEGIGPKSQQALYEAGVLTFQHVANTSVERLQSILDANELRLLDPGTWPEQATFLVRGDMAGLEAFQDALKGGRRV